MKIYGVEHTLEMKLASSRYSCLPHALLISGFYSVAGGTKPAIVDTGAVVSVPLFVNVGDVIVVDTRTGQYMSRA